MSQALQSESHALRSWNEAPPAVAEHALLACCVSPQWAETLVARRPFPSPSALLGEAEDAWFELPEAEWLTAFRCHPRIGEQRADVSNHPAFASSSAAEQRAAQATLDPVKDALAAGNRAFEARFGFLYLVFASGRTAPELLALLEARLNNDRNTELREAARQQWLITEFRMKKWLESPTHHEPPQEAS